MTEPTLFERLEREFPENFDACFDFSFGAGWDNLVENLVREVIKRDPAIKIEQVKEKFGELRFYTSPTSESVRDLIEAVEEDSSNVCERCGAPGKLVSKGGWHMTVCDSCWDKS